VSQYLYYTSAVNATTLASSLSNVGSPSVNSVTGFPSSYPFKLLIDWGLSSQEAILVTSAPTGAGPYTVPCIRGVDGTTAQVHSSGAQVVHGFSADELNILASLSPVVTGARFGADPTGAVACDSAVAAAAATLPASGGAVLFPPGTYKFTSGVTITQPGVYLAAMIPGTVTFNYTGSGDCVRMYSTTLTTPNGVYGGGVIGGIMIDLNGAGNGAVGIHAGDIFRMRFDCSVRGAAIAGANSKNAWFDNQYWWAEQITGQIFSEQGPVVFDNSANLSGSATGSFDRTVLDIFCDGKGKSNLVVFQNGAFIGASGGAGAQGGGGGRLGIYGNTDYGSSQFYVLSFLPAPTYSYTATSASPCVFTAAGSYYRNGTSLVLSGSPPAGFTAGTTYFVVNASGSTFQLSATKGGAAINSTSTGSGTLVSTSQNTMITNSVVNIDVECNGTSGTQPQTINFGLSTAFTCGIFNCTGIMSFNGNNAFAQNGTNWLGNFEFDGPVYGDAHLMACSDLGRVPYSNGAVGNNGSINTRFCSVSTVTPTGNVTGIILGGDSSANWREVTVVNTSAFTLTMDVAGTSHVADGTSDVIQALSAAKYVWNPGGLWYRVK